MRPLSAREKGNGKLADCIVKAHERGKKIYGSQLISAELKSQGILCSRNRIIWLTRKNSIVTKTKMGYRITTLSRHAQSMATNLLEEKSVERPNAAWVSNIAQISAYEGWAVPCRRSRHILPLVVG